MDSNSTAKDSKATKSSINKFLGKIQNFMGVTPKTNAVIKESLGLTFKQKEVLISAMIKRYTDQYRYERCKWSDIDP